MLFFLGFLWTTAQDRRMLLPLLSAGAVFLGSFLQIVYYQHYALTGLVCSIVSCRYNRAPWAAESAISMAAGMARPSARPPIAVGNRRRQPAGPVLELGSGTGMLLNRLAAAVPDREFCGLDPLDSYVRFAAEKSCVRNVAYIRGVAEEAQQCLPRNDFGVVLSNDVLHHCVDLSRVAEQVSLVSRPDAQWLLIEPNCLNLYSFCRQLFVPGESVFWPCRFLRAAGRAGWGSPRDSPASATIRPRAQRAVAQWRTGRRSATEDRSCPSIERSSRHPTTSGPNQPLACGRFGSTPPDPGPRQHGHRARRFDARTPPEGRLTLPPDRSMNLRCHAVRSIAILQYDHRRLPSRWRARWPCPRPEPAPAEIAGGVRLGTARSCRGDRDAAPRARQERPRAAGTPPGGTD